MDRNCKILIVDDTPMFRELESIFLARYGVVTTADSGEAAFEAARRDRPDVIVSDLHMPGLDGALLCEKIRRDEDLRETPVILLIPGENPQDRARAVRAGADDVIAKPISRISLVESVKRFLSPSYRSGLARVELATKVCIRSHGTEDWGQSLNLSRGGMYVAAEHNLPVATEVELEFLLPEVAAPLHSTARVVWGRKTAEGTPTGMGLQFLALDCESTQQIENFVFERAEDGSPPATSAQGVRS